MSDHTPRARKSTENFGRPASTYSDFYIRTLFQPGLVDTQYNVGLLRTFVNTAILAFSHYYTRRAVIQLLSRPGIQSYILTSFKTSEYILVNSTSNFCRIVIASYRKQ